MFYPQGKADKFCSHVFKVKSNIICPDNHFVRKVILFTKVFDTDSSGEIDFVEFLIAISITAQGDAKKKLELAFRMYDVDKNGRVDKKEMEKIIEVCDACVQIFEFILF